MPVPLVTSVGQVSSFSIHVSVGAFSSPEASRSSSCLASVANFRSVLYIM